MLRKPQTNRTGDLKVGHCRGFPALSRLDDANLLGFLPFDLKVSSGLKPSGAPPAEAGASGVLRTPLAPASLRGAQGSALGNRVGRLGALKGCGPRGGLVPVRSLYEAEAGSAFAAL